VTGTAALWWSGAAHTITAPRVAGVLAFYAALFVVIRLARERIEPWERRTFAAIALAWAVPVFIANHLLYRAGIMSFLPWVNNFMHSFLWIGLCLTWLYLGVRESRPMAVQIVLFTTFSLVVKYAEQKLFGTWDLGDFFGILHGNGWYVMGWSLADGTYPVLTLYGLRLAARRIPGLAVI
jgi:hypothetical protein